MNGPGRRAERKPAASRRLPHSPFDKDPVDQPPPDVFEVGDRVSHDRYGMGTVVGIEGTASVVVDFGTDTRRISIPNPKLSRI